jgi:hypothetical protein
MPTGSNALGFFMRRRDVELGDLYSLFVHFPRVLADLLFLFAIFSSFADFGTRP